MFKIGQMFLLHSASQEDRPGVFPEAAGTFGKGCSNRNTTMLLSQDEQPEQKNRRPFFICHLQYLLNRCFDPELKIAQQQLERP